MYNIPMPYKEKGKRNSANRRSQQRKALKDRRCEVCSKTEDVQHHRAAPDIRVIALCGPCRAKLLE